ncbi:MAG: hypothetical protein VX403_10685, partial [Planctomycetota bacterium]|nr:hypothetical protein [Planctomycetota bacterium]
MSATRGRIVLLEGIHQAADSVLSAAGLEVDRLDGAVEKERLHEVLAGASMVGIRSRTQLDAEVLGR